MSNLELLFKQKAAIAEEIAALRVDSKEIDNKINDLISKEFEASRKAKDKHFGALTLNLDGTAVKQTIVKKVVWDQEQLEDCAEILRSSNIKPEEYMKIEYKISEKDYGRLPEGPKGFFEKARTEVQGSVKVELVDDKG
jgi:hypothetical protein